MLIFSYRHVLSYETVLPAVFILCPIAISYCILTIVSIELLKYFSFCILLLLSDLQAK